MNSKYIWLSHELKTTTPAYGGGVSFQVEHQKQISLGCSCNSVKLIFPNHLGTHVDVPYHFIEAGKKISDYSEDEWIFEKVALIETIVVPDEIIELSKIKSILDNINDCDLLLIKTNFERYRQKEIYWKNSPAFSDEIAAYLKEKFTSLLAIGFDAISLTGYQHRDLGRKAHRAFLSQNIRIFEDMHLSTISNEIKIKKIIAMPLRFENADGSPCTIIAEKN